MTSAARERHARRRKNPKARQRNILGSTRGSRVGFGGSPKQFFIPEKFAKAGRVRSPIQDRTQPKYRFSSQDRRSHLWCCCRGCGRRRRRSSKIKIHRRRFLRTGLRFEKWARPESEHAGKQICREGADGGVVL